MLARLQGHCGWTNITRVSPVGLNGILLPLGQCVGISTSTPGVLAYCANTYRPTSAAPSQAAARRVQKKARLLDLTGGNNATDSFELAMPANISMVQNN